ncbi:D-alanyl-D-alanine carboxypeptidase DacF precursor [Clostridium tepidiprofundi DSM 19306]|uniref:D-alanyl-D-alanine carboxypeptidase DacF n=1 Tax=Clostridium tepidiprofundi DSM 19306 TaxID=1121338 RepID=A0A151AVT0_9CLOT|nr:D-alanyl-D-alanine carboxypeptidase [Clostridium tepidiprofundi]KYH31672.1 D-alanyl-D-alanine carboxypeptidase DacF precursor [Clostridium tepidiprofundi DSM 19306]
MKKSKYICVFILLFIYLFPLNTYASELPPNINGQYAVTIDLETNEIIYAKNIDTRAYPASITKLLTAVLLTENFDKNNILTYSSKAQAQEPVSYTTRIHYLPSGETMTAQNAMDALLLKSCNDIAYMIAENVCKSSKDFADLMNSRAVELNLNFIAYIKKHKVILANN